MKRIIICILILIMVFSSSVSAEMDFDLSADADKIVSTEIELNPGELVKVIVLKENADINNTTDNFRKGQLGYVKKDYHPNK